MQWRGRRESGNVDDLRGQRISRGGGMVGLGGTGLVLVVVFALLTGQNPLDLLGQIAAQQQDGATSTTTSDEPYQESANDREQRQFVAVVLGDTEDVWHGVF